MDFDFDKFIEKYSYEINEHTEREFEHTLPPEELLKFGHIPQERYEEEKIRYEQGTLVHHPAKRGVKDETKIKWKVQYLQDAVIRRASTKKHGAFSLNSQILKTVIGDEYKVMLDVLRDMGYLILGDGKNGQSVNKYYYYEWGGYSSIYSLPKDKVVEIVDITNVTIKKYISKEKEKISAFRSKYIYPELHRRFGENFSIEYEKSLKQIKVKDSKGLNAYIRERIEENPHSIHYYTYLKNKLSDKNKIIQRVDNAGRIYHILTNADRNIKQFLNIEISADCKNSHPLLLNYFIFRWHGISLEDSYTISSAMHRIPETDIREHLKKIISDTVLESLKDDELEYMYLTSNGMLWDRIMEKHHDIDRNEVKEKMFAEVFYSNEAKTRKWQLYATEFKKQFPNVMNLILLWKNPENDYVKGYMKKHKLISKPTASLSIAMMNLESRIFGEILKRIYKKKWKAIHIHDCIIVPETENKKKPTKEDIMNIMKDVYKVCGLYPTFD